MVLTMLHWLARFLCVVSLLSQVAVGALPPGESCLGCLRHARAADSCCCGEDEAATIERYGCTCPLGGEPGQGGCDQCLRVQVVNHDGTIAVDGRLIHGNADAIVFQNLPASLPPIVEVGLIGHRCPAATESPPHLQLLHTVCLLV